MAWQQALEGISLLNQLISKVKLLGLEGSCLLALSMDS
jgi:hypothetical protein